MFFRSGFNQDIGPWPINSVTTMEDMLTALSDTGILSNANYDATLQGWADEAKNGGGVQMNVTLDAGTDVTTTTMAGEDARDS